MGELVDTQNRFALNLGFLYLEFEKRGLIYTLGDSYRDPRVFGEVGESKGYGHKNSCHKLRLAQDINIIVDGKLIEDDEYHRDMHEFWQFRCGGAKMIKHDPNHYSFKYRGMI